MNTNKLSITSRFMAEISRSFTQHWTEKCWLSNTITIFTINWSLHDVITASPRTHIINSQWLKPINFEYKLFNIGPRRLFSFDILWLCSNDNASSSNIMPPGLCLEQGLALWVGEVRSQKLIVLNILIDQWEQTLSAVTQVKNATGQNGDGQVMWLSI